MKDWLKIFLIFLFWFGALFAYFNLPLYQVSFSRYDDWWFAHRSFCNVYNTTGTPIESPVNFFCFRW